MILALSIKKVSNGQYQINCPEAPQGATVHNSIADGLRYYGSDIPTGIAQFVNIEYGGCHLETTAVSELETKAEELASRLMQITAEIHDTY